MMLQNLKLQEGLSILFLLHHLKVKYSNLVYLLDFQSATCTGVSKAGVITRLEKWRDGGAPQPGTSLISSSAGAAAAHSASASSASVTAGVIVLGDDPFIVRCVERWQLISGLLGAATTPRAS